MKYLLGAAAAIFGGTYGYSWLAPESKVMVDHKELRRAAEERKTREADERMRLIEEQLKALKK